MLFYFPSSSEDESESEEGGLDDSICPAGCDPVLFEQACTLREQRLDLEEQMTEEKRALDLLRRELESLKKKAKAVEAHVKTALSELQVGLLHACSLVAERPSLTSLPSCRPSS